MASQSDRAGNPAVSAPGDWARTFMSYCEKSALDLVREAMNETLSTYQLDLCLNSCHNGVGRVSGEMPTRKTWIWSNLAKA